MAAATGDERSVVSKQTHSDWEEPEEMWFDSPQEQMRKEEQKEADKLPIWTVND